MYKAFHTKKYYLAVDTFPKTAKKVSKVYLTGFRYWKSDDMLNYSIVIYRFRIIFGIKREQFGSIKKNKMIKSYEDIEIKYSKS